MTKQLILALTILVPIVAFSQTKSTPQNGDACFTMTPLSPLNDTTCEPVKINILFSDCKTGATINSMDGVTARFDCKSKLKKLKYWHDDTMYYGDLEKHGQTYIVTDTHSLVYGKKDSTTAVVTPPSSVSTSDLLPPAKAILPELSASEKIEKPSTDIEIPATKPATPVPQPQPVVAAAAAEPTTLLNDIKINGLLDFYYLSNLNQNSDPVAATTTVNAYGAAPTTNVIYMPNTYNDQFTINMAVLGAKKEAKPWGFNIDLAFGPEADAMAGVGSDNSLRALNQAYLIYKTPFDLVIEVGRFHSFLGFESHFAPENMNYTKSYGVVYITPSLVDGVHLMIPFANHLEAHFYFMNGWDVHYENNRSKTFGGKITYKPFEEIEITASAMGGNEYVTGNDSLTTVLEGSLLWVPHKEIKLAFDFTSAEASVSGNDPRKANSLAVYGWWSFMKDLALSARYEMYNDDALFPTGLATQTYVTSMNQTINAITGTLEYIADEHLHFKAEYRTDMTTALVPAFKDSSGLPTSTQSIVVGSAILSF